MEANQKLNISNLIEKAENLVYDGRLNMADEATIPVQIVELENGSKYQINLTAKFIEK